MFTTSALVKFGNKLILLLKNTLAICWERLDLLAANFRCVPQTCSWFYLMLPCYLRHTACENNIIKYSNELWWCTPDLVYHWLVEFDCDLLTVTFYINDYAHIGWTTRYSGWANTCGSRSCQSLKNKYFHILFHTKIRYIVTGPYAISLYNVTIFSQSHPFVTSSIYHVTIWQHKLV